MADEKNNRAARGSGKGKPAGGKKADGGRPAAAQLHIPPPRGGTRANFAARMGDAGYATCRRYDAVKNAFLSYRPAEEKGKKLNCRLTNSGETFGVGRTVFAKLCLVSGYLRLFLALDPKAYNQNKYHHKDCTEIARYAKIPFMIKISSDRQQKYALELIGEVMAAHGFVPDEGYLPKDLAGMFAAYASKHGEAAAADGAWIAVSDEPEPGEPAAIDVRLPVRAKVVDREGGKLGKIRSSVWYGEEDKENLGEFRKEDTNVFLYRGEERFAYVDKNDNILTLADKYVATIRRFHWLPLLIILLILALLTALSVLLSAYFMNRSSDYIPVLFVADEEGTSWEEIEDLPVFYNEAFGDTIVAPGMSGSYRFMVENRNDDTLLFQFTFAEENEYGIAMRYRLRRDNTHISGTDGYVTTKELGVEDMTIEPRSKSVFTIEWYWQDNDPVDTAAGENGAVYKLLINFIAAIAE